MAMAVIILTTELGPDLSPDLHATQGQTVDPAPEAGPSPGQGEGLGPGQDRMTTEVVEGVVGVGDLAPDHAGAGLDPGRTLGTVAIGEGGLGPPDEDVRDLVSQGQGQGHTTASTEKSLRGAEAQPSLSPKRKDDLIRKRLSERQRLTLTSMKKTLKKRTSLRKMTRR